MIEIKYQSSNGNEYNLVGDRMRVTDGSFHRYKWERDVSEMENGDNLKKFKKEPITYSITLNFRGKLQDRKQLLDSLTNDFEHDVATKKAGTFYFGECYIKGYVVESETKVSDIKNVWSQRMIQIYCPYPFWITEQKISIQPITESEEPADNNTYPYTYPYTYGSPSKTTSINIDHYAASDFRMIVYGPTANVSVTINGHIYHVEYPIEDDEYMVIDSRSFLPPNERIYLVRQNGEKVNVFNYRDPEYSIFEKIPAGDITIDYSRKYGIDLIVFLERSEPKWK